MKTSTTYVIRPVGEHDLEAIYHLATQTGKGLTTLPADRDVLRQRIENSLYSFARTPSKPGNEQYFFVLENLASGRVVGTSAVVAKVGGFEPFYSYRIETTIKESKTLNVHKEIDYLQLVADHNGPSEIGTLFLAPESRGGSNGRLLSLSRFVFMAEHRERFEAAVIAEMRGKFEAGGGSVFWEALGRHFFAVDYDTADHMVMKDKSFIADLMPRHPIYIPLLPEDAQAVIGAVHDNTRPALALLEKEGFTFCREVDIFEAGPIFGCPLTEIRTVRDSQVQPVSRIANADDEAAIDSRDFIVARVHPVQDFRACVSPVRIAFDGVALPNATASALCVAPGDAVRIVPLRG